MLHIVNAPNPVLSAKTKPVEKIDKTITDLIAQMKVTLDATNDPEGVGLAAPQVGRSLQLFIMKPHKKAKTIVCINPTIVAMEDKKKQVRKTAKKKDEETLLEGCLSLPAIWGEVKRHDLVTLSFLDEKGSYKQEIFEGFLATIVQHEYDHLQGVLFPKRVLEQKKKLYKAVKDENGETVFEEIKI